MPLSTATTPTVPALSIQSFPDATPPLQSPSQAQDRITSINSHIKSLMNLQTGNTSSERSQRASNYHWSIIPATIGTILTAILTIGGIIRNNLPVGTTGGISLLMSAVSMYVASQLAPKITISLLQQKSEQLLRQMQNQLQEIEEIVKDLEKKKTDLKSTSDEFKARVEAIIQGLRTQLEEEKILSATHNKDVLSLKETISSLETTANTLKSQVRSLNAVNTQLKAANTLLETKEKTLAEERDAVMSANVALKTTIDELNARLQQTQDDLQTLLRDVQALRSLTSSVQSSPTQEGQEAEKKAFRETLLASLDNSAQKRERVRSHHGSGSVSGSASRNPSPHRSAAPLHLSAQAYSSQNTAPSTSKAPIGGLLVPHPPEGPPPQNLQRASTLDPKPVSPRHTPTHRRVASTPPAQSAIRALPAGQPKPKSLTQSTSTDSNQG